MKELFRRTGSTFSSDQSKTDQIPDDVWVKCPACREILYQKQLKENLKVCPCNRQYHMRLTGREWLGLLDVGSFEEQDIQLWPEDPLNFYSAQGSYAEKLKETQQRTGLIDTVISGLGTIDGMPLALAVCDFEFMGASMGSVYGEKMTRAAEHAARLRIPLLTINRSGGARMQEGVISLMQMAKISMALTKLAAVQQPHIALLVDPCYGGVTASYASVADIIIAEPGANIGFAGKRVIEQTIRQKLPPDFQTAEFMLAHGLVDMVTPRTELRTLLARLLHIYQPTRHPANKN